jgi:hypothetical protein
VIKLILTDWTSVDEAYLVRFFGHPFVRKPASTNSCSGTVTLIHGEERSDECEECDVLTLNEHTSGAACVSELSAVTLHRHFADEKSADTFRRAVLDAVQNGLRDTTVSTIENGYVATSWLDDGTNQTLRFTSSLVPSGIDVTVLVFRTDLRP